MPPGRRKKGGAHGRKPKGQSAVRLKSATIEFDRGAYSCPVRNLSENGAALEVPYAAIIPHEFQLTIQSDQARRHCRVIWRKENRLGVQFGQAEGPQL